jgi:TPR repeat protein
MAAAQRNAEAQFALAVAYENGDGVPQDSVTAFNWCAPPHPSVAYACKH